MSDILVDELRISGFKSFADRVEIPFREGLTVIVGPNGAGKSNIVDGLRWLVGESSARKIRGLEMEDIIFSGASQRMPKLRQEVELVLSNVDKGTIQTLGNEVYHNYDNQKIVIKRVLERGKGSKYQVNGHDILRRDANIFFGDIGIGKLSTSIVGQGNVAELMNMSGEERRKVIEASAGLQGIKERYGEANNKLNAVSENLEKINSLENVFIRQIKELKGQANKAKKYKSYSKKLRNIKTYIQLTRFESVKKEIKKIEIETVELTTQRIQLERQVLSGEQALSAQREILQEKRKIRDQNLLEEQRINLLISGIEQKEEQYQVALQTLSREIKQSTELLSLESQNIRQAKDKIAEIKTSINEWSEKRSSPADLNKLSDEVEKLFKSKKEQEQNSDSSYTKMVEFKNRKQQLEELINISKRRIQKQEIYCRELAVEIKNLQSRVDNSSLENLEIKRDKIQTRLNEIKGILRQISLEKEQKENALQVLKESHDRRVRELESESMVLRENMLSIEAELKILTKMIRGVESIKDSVAKLLIVEEGYESLVDRALGEGLMVGVISKGQDDKGWTDLGDLKQYDLPSPTIIMREIVREYPQALERFLSGTGIVETNEEGWSLQSELKPGQILISKQGGIWRWDGYVDAREQKEEMSQRQFLANKANYQKLQNSYNKLKDDENTCRERIEESIKTHENETLGINNFLQSLKERQGRTVDEESELEERLENLREELADKSREKERLSASIEGKQEVYQDAQNNLSDETRICLGHEQQLDMLGSGEKLLKEYQTLSERRNHALAKWEEKRDKLKAIVGEQEMTKRILTNLERENKEWSERLEKSLKREKELLTLDQKLKSQELSLKNTPKTIESEKQKLLNRATKTNSLRSESQQMLEEEEIKERQLEDSAKQIGRELHQTRERLASLSAKKDVMIENLEEVKVEESNVELSDELDVLKERFESGGVESLEYDKERLEKLRDNLGVINLLAEDELLAKERAHEERSRQVEDVQEAKRSLERSIKELETESKQKFLLIFDKINDYFDDNFRYIFEGSSARLKLSDSEDILNSELDLEVKFSGKRVSHLSLLSGGEQAIVSLCLIFAIFRANPAPLYVLDEVDAALDDVNVAKFCKLMRYCGREMGMKFLVVTHHRFTMAASDQLFGVTMVEKGVSKVVSVDMSEAIDKWAEDKS